MIRKLAALSLTSTLILGGCGQGAVSEHDTDAHRHPHHLFCGD